MRQVMSEKNCAKIRNKTGLPIQWVVVRGGTDHRKDLYLIGGSIKHLWPDGEITDPDPPDSRWT